MLASLRSEGTSSGQRMKQCEKWTSNTSKTRQCKLLEMGPAWSIWGRVRGPGRLHELEERGGRQSQRDSRARSQVPSGAPGVHILRTEGKQWEQAWHNLIYLFNISSPLTIFHTSDEKGWTSLRIHWVDDGMWPKEAFSFITSGRKLW